MESKLAERAKKDFIDVLSEFVHMLKDRFPNCDQVDENAVWFDGVVLHNPSREKKAIEDWYEMLCHPLSKKVKYAKALERLLGQQGTIYHAIFYSDQETIDISSTSRTGLLEKLSLQEKLKEMEEKERTVYWDYLQTLSRYCLSGLGKTAPRVPTREEITANIRQAKQPSGGGGGGSVHRAFQTAMSTLCQQGSAPDFLADASEETIRATMKRWSDFASETVEGRKVADLCADHSDSLFPLLHDRFPEIPLILSCSDSTWTAMAQMTSITAVSKSVPTNMMSRIEGMASRLAEDIASGKADLNSVDLNDIGQQVLSGCDEKEMSKFADNISDLLPVLKNMDQFRPR